MTKKKSTTAKRSKTEQVKPTPQVAAPSAPPEKPILQDELETMHMLQESLLRTITSMTALMVERRNRFRSRIACGAAVLPGEYAWDNESGLVRRLAAPNQ